ncbi:Lrp/AsnC family transcriptional regulator [Haloprofundus halobius]|uniref:Lrp/AsnC family transcriptional regulator n=1 Tax=Haloprofundus halobius TaxID=2876194 RepID=UPI001CCD6DC0|nr:winged helix-turn-helix transcriptional regulator [Haloprofundus halobius]
MPNLDQTDLGILYLLQEDARNATTAQIAERVDVSGSTVANRIHQLEDRGIIKGYQPTVDYEATGFDNHFILVGSVDFEDQESFVDEAMEVDGVVTVREFMTNDENISIEVVARCRDSFRETTDTLKSVGFEISKIKIITDQHEQPFNHFGETLVR